MNILIIILIIIPISYQVEPENEQKKFPIILKKPAHLKHQPENCLGMNLHEDIGITKIFPVERYYKTDLVCTKNSVITRLFQTHEREINLTCNGVTIVSNSQHWAKGVFKFTNGQRFDDTFHIYPYSIIYNYSNGNIIVQECGTVADGRCKGDYYTGLAIFEANEQDACRLTGHLTGATATYKEVIITGRCPSICRLGSSTIAYGARAIKKAKVMEHSKRNEVEIEDNYVIQKEIEKIATTNAPGTTKKAADAA